MKQYEQVQYKLSEIGSIAADISKIIGRGGVECGLIGGLGAGKTTLVSSILETLGYRGTVTSPTFVLQNEYTTDSIVVEHWDLYRLSGLPEELLEPPSKNVLRLIEWADKFPELSGRVDYLFSISMFPEQASEDLRFLEWIKVGSP